MTTESWRMRGLVLFDLDGVILDSRANMEAAWSAVAAEFGIEIPFESYFAEIGRPFQDIMTRLGLADQGKRIEQVFRRASARHLFDTPIFEGMETLLSNVAAYRIKLGIVTSKDFARTQLILDRLPVEFSIVMTPNDRLRGKPAPDHLLQAMARCNTDPAATIFIGDMDSDADAARRARIDYAHVLWGYGDPPPDCAFTAQTPADLQHYLLG
ncbi:HAD-superfamily hydrolase subfamily IA [Fulvimarina pelagi HTCC2506]|uniref:phosphoglycolate phosphatase n=1 Tax=Fulvimarina pelagi HTCC2506 TaxID=314231 RepID=Q0G7J0_9HYPH|nr:HAD-IA family hydrolase [Fulvimarina pelagi]EAU42374.1 HAD-superfamily hydrolase subfamily IA [Fulvimarina pelagi HTCC2506]